MGDEHSTIDGQSVTIKNGVAYFDEPYFTNAVLFANKHRMRDFIGKDVDAADCADMTYVVAVPVTPEDTKELRKQFKENNMLEKGYIIFQGQYEEEGVLYID